MIWKLTKNPQLSKVTLHKALKRCILSLLSEKCLTEPQWSVSTALFAAPTHVDTFLYLPAVKSVEGRHSETTLANQVNADKQACLPPHWQICTHTFRFITAGGGFEAVANCPASWARPRRASSVLLFDAGWVINLDKSFSGSRLMCPQHQHTRKHAIHIYHNSSQRRAWGRPEHVNAEKIVSRCARGNLRLCDRTIGKVLPYKTETHQEQKQDAAAAEVSNSKF